jgi:hypothetical protein
VITPRQVQLEGLCADIWTTFELGPTDQSTGEGHQAAMGRPDDVIGGRH